MKAKKYGAYWRLREIVKKLGGTMYHDRRAIRFGAWKISLEGRTKTFPATGMSRLPELDGMYKLRDGVFPTKWDDYEPELVQDAEQKLLNLIESPNCWIFQAVVEQFDLCKALREERDGWWRVTRYAEEIRRGDKIIFWLGGKERGVYGLGELTSDPQPNKHQGPHKLTVDLKYTWKIDPPILVDELLEHPILKTLSVLRPPFQESNFRATIHQWNAINDLIGIVYPLQLGDWDQTQIANGVQGIAARFVTTMYRIRRDTELARKVKRLHNHKCQICGYTVHLPDGSRYAEAHHVQPLGKPHDGPDVIGNIVCVCPNHHTELDYGVQALSIDALRRVHGHPLDPKYVEYHNRHIHKPKKS